MTLATAIRNTFIAALLVFPLSGAFAEEEQVMGTLQGTGIDMKAYDHTIAGDMKGFLVWGAVDEEAGISELIMRKDGQFIKTVFKRENGKFGGTIRHTVDARTIETTLSFVRADKVKNEITLNINGQDVAVQVKSDQFEEGHFVNPTYRAVFNGEQIVYTLKGRACYGYSTQLAFLVLGAYLH